MIFLSDDDDVIVYLLLTLCVCVVKLADGMYHLTAQKGCVLLFDDLKA